MNVDKLSLQ